MSNRNHRPEWHEPVEAVVSEAFDPLEDTIEAGDVVLIDGPIDPVPLAPTRSNTEYNTPRHSAGPMPEFGMAGREKTNEMNDVAQSVGQKAQDAAKGIADKAQDAAQTVADKAGDALETAKSAAATAPGVLSNAAAKIGTASATGAQSAGTALWTLIQRNPLQAIAVFASLIWLFRSNKAAASQPPVSLTDAAEKVGSVAGQVQVAATNLRSQVQDQAQHGAGWFSRTLQENPLAVGAMAIVFGAGLGFAVPETPYEDKWLGKTRDTLADKAQGVAQEFGQKVQTVAQTAVHEAIESVKEEAKNQGLTA